MPLNVAVVDSFTRANGGLGANWTTDPLGDGSGAPGITSNEFSASFYDAARYNALTVNTADGDLEVAYTVKAFPADNGQIYHGLVQNPGTGTSDGYMLQIQYETVGNESWEFYRYDNSSSTTLGTGTLALSLNDVIILRRSTAGVWRIIHDVSGVETELDDFTDTTYTGAFTGFLGAFDGSSAVRLDDFAVGSYGGGENKSGTDSYTFTDAAGQIAASLSLTDSATLSEASEVAISTDSAEGTLSESSALEQRYTATDSGTLTESASVSDDTSKAGTDSLAFADSSSLAISEAVSVTDSIAFTDTSGAIVQSAVDSASMAESASVDTGAPPPTGSGYQTQLPTVTTAFVEYSSQVEGSVRITACTGGTLTTESTGTMRVTTGTGTLRTSEVAYSIVTTQASGTLRTTTAEATV